MTSIDSGYHTAAEQLTPPKPHEGGRLFGGQHRGSAAQKHDETFGSMLSSENDKEVKLLTEKLSELHLESSDSKLSSENPEVEDLTSSIAGFHLSPPLSPAALADRAAYADAERWEALVCSEKPDLYKQTIEDLLRRDYHSEMVWKLPARARRELLAVCQMDSQMESFFPGCLTHASYRSRRHLYENPGELSDRPTYAEIWTKYAPAFDIKVQFDTGIWGREGTGQVESEVGPMGESHI